MGVMPQTSAGTAVVAEREDASVVGVGRHNLGANLFWYLTDPSGNMFEFFADMDQIVDDAVWEREHLKRDWEGADGPAGFSIWGPKDPPDRFFNLDTVLFDETSTSDDFVEFLTLPAYDMID